jgi:iron complex outermembrane receptor protein
VLPLILGNETHANTYGGEIFANWSVTHRWRISPGYSRLHMAIVRNPSGVDVQPELIPGSVPSQQFQIRSSIMLTRRLEWDSSLYYVGRLAYGAIPAYTRVDSRLAWRMGESLEFSVGGQNLLTPEHAEFPDELGTSHTLIERNVFGRVTWRF